MADAAASGAPVTWALHEGDCLGPEGMARLEAGSVDCAILDPPYSEHVHARLGSENRNDGTASRDALTFAHIDQFTADAVAQQLARVVRRWWLVFCDERAVAVWLAAVGRSGAEFVRLGTWVKAGGMPQMSGDRPAAGAEWVVVAHGARAPGGGRMRWNGGGRPATWLGPVREDVAREHPAQKPEWLMSALVADFTDPGETILDPFAGSGTTGVACIRAGRNFIGWERDPRYAAIARKRLEAAREQPGLPFARAPKPKQGRLLP